MERRARLPAAPDRIISGGQTGADRGGLDAAIELGIPHGGSCPRGRLAEDGAIPDRYRLEETASAQYQVRTARNVCEADGTLIFTIGPLTAGTALTARLARKHGKPLLHLDLQHLDAPAATATVAAWLVENNVRVLNVAGSRESGARGIQAAVRDLLISILGHTPAAAGPAQR